MDKVLLIATGGTIAMRKDEAGKVVPAVSGHELIDSLPELTYEVNWEICELSNVASCNIDPDHMKKLMQLVTCVNCIQVMWTPLILEILEL